MNGSALRVLLPTITPCFARREALLAEESDSAGEAGNGENPAGSHHGTFYCWTYRFRTAPVSIFFSKSVRPTPILILSMHPEEQYA
jgi:hypothetical protein